MIRYYIHKEFPIFLEIAENGDCIKTEFIIEDTGSFHLIRATDTLSSIGEEYVEMDSKIYKRAIDHVTTLYKAAYNSIYTLYQALLLNSTIRGVA